MKFKIVGCLAATLLITGAAIAAIRSLKEIGDILDDIAMTRDDLIS